MSLVFLLIVFVCILRSLTIPWRIRVEPFLTPVEPVLPSSFLVFVEKVSTCLFTSLWATFTRVPYGQVPGLSLIV